MKSRISISRRHFLAASVAAAAGCATSVQTGGVKPEIRLGLIGCGARGTALLAALTGDPAFANVKVTAVCDAYAPRLQSASETSGAHAEHDWRRLVRSRDIDAIIIATPDHLHAPMAIAAMEAGKDVYCECPMALTLEQAGAFRECADRTERVVQLGAAEASESRWRVATDVVRSGELGRVRWAQAAVVPGAAEAFDAGLETRATAANLDWAAFLGDAPGREIEPERFFRWRNYWDYSGGIATSLYYGQLAPLLIALGDEYPERVSAAGGVYVQDGRETPDSFVVNAEYAGHSIVMSHSAAGGSARPAVIRGERASLEVADGSVRVVPEPSHGGAARTIAVEPAESHLADWLRCVKTRGRCLCDEELGYKTMVAVAMAVEAYKQAKTLQYNVATNIVHEAPCRVAA